MVHLEKLNQISYNSDGEALAWYDLSVSTAAELPALGSVVFGAKIQAPSRAQIIQADEPTIVTLDEDGNWYPEQSDSRASTLSAPQLSLTPNMRGSVNQTAQPQEEAEVPEAEPEVEETAEPEGGEEERARHDDFAEF